MNKRIFINFISLCVIMLMFATACTKDKDDEAPTVEERDKFIGSYNVIDTLYNSTPNLYLYGDYIMLVSEDPSDTSKIIISNLNNTGQNITASVSGNIFIALEQAYGSGGMTLRGTGNKEGNIIKFSFISGGVGDQIEIYGIATEI